jgi:hypothetical protein
MTAKAQSIFAGVLVLCGMHSFAQDYRDSLHVAVKSQYLKQVQSNPDKALVEIVKYVPAIKLDIRYVES